MTDRYRLGAAFELQLGNPIAPRLAKVGTFDGTVPSLVVATSGNRVLIHTPGGDGSGVDGAIRSLTFGRETTALACHALLPEAEGGKGDTLIVGAATSLLAYNVEKNSEYFFKQVEDGVRALCFGQVVDSAPPLSIVGGNCSIFGFDASGAERFWTVTGDLVSAMVLMPWTHDAMMPSLVAASEDYEIRVFNGEDVATTIAEVSKVTAMQYSGVPGRFAYLLSNGTLGMYERGERQWRIKGKCQPTSVAFCDVDFDGVEEIVCGWDDGHVEVRSGDPARRGECLSRMSFSAAVSAVLSADYRQNGRPLPIVCTADGGVCGLLVLESSATEAHETKSTQLLEALKGEQKELLAQVASLEEQLVKQRSGTVDVTMPDVSTQLTHELRPNFELRTVELVLSVTGGGECVVIQSAVLRGDRALGGEEMRFVYAVDPRPTLACVLSLDLDVACEVQVSAMVGLAFADVCQVFDVTVRVPSCAMCVAPSPSHPQVAFATPDGYSTIPFDLPVERLRKWLLESFNVSTSSPSSTPDRHIFQFVNIRDGKCFEIQLNTSADSLTIFAEDMDSCGDLTQSLGRECGIEETNATCDFPRELQQLEGVLRDIEEFSRVRAKLTAEIAEASGLLKLLMVRAEDARIQGDMVTMRRMYGLLYDRNKELMGEYLKRLNNHEELLKVLRQANTAIQSACKLRLGRHKALLQTALRSAVKGNNAAQLVRLIRTGVE